jgi:hypothetical protein
MFAPEVHDFSSAVIDRKHRAEFAALGEVSLELEAHTFEARLDRTLNKCCTSGK